MFAGVTAFNELQTFKLENERALDPYFIEHLARFPNINKLSLFNTPLIAPMTPLLLNNPHIAYLDLSGDSNIQSETIDFLAE